MKTVILISIVFFLSLQCNSVRPIKAIGYHEDSIQDNEVYASFSHDSVFLSYYFSDKEAVEDQLVDSVVLEVPRYNKKLVMITNSSPLYKKVFLTNFKNQWESTHITMTFYKDDFKIEKQEFYF